MGSSPAIPTIEKAADFCRRPFAFPVFMQACELPFGLKTTMKVRLKAAPYSGFYALVAYPDYVIQRYRDMGGSPVGRIVTAGN